MNKKELVEKIEKLISEERQRGQKEEEFYKNKKTGRLNLTGREVQTRNSYRVLGMNDVLDLIEKNLHEF